MVRLINQVNRHLTRLDEPNQVNITWLGEPNPNHDVPDDNQVNCLTLTKFPLTFYVVRLGKRSVGACRYLSLTQHVVI